MLKTTGSSDLAQKDNDNEVVGGGDDKNLFKSKKLKNAKSGFRHILELRKNLHS